MSYDYFDKWWSTHVRDIQISEAVLKSINKNVAEKLNVAANQNKLLKKSLLAVHKKAGNLDFVYWLCINLKYMTRLGLSQQAELSNLLKLLWTLQTNLVESHKVAVKGLEHVKGTIEKMNDGNVNSNCFGHYESSCYEIVKQLDETIKKTVTLLTTVQCDEYRNEGNSPEGERYFNQIEINKSLLEYFFKSTKWAASGSKVSNRPKTTHLRDFFLAIISEHFRKLTKKPLVSLAWDIVHIFITPTTKQKLQDGKYKSKGHLAEAAIGKCKTRGWDVQSTYQQVELIYSQSLKSP